MFENEWFPVANSVGVSWAEFWHMNPRIINLLIKGQRQKLKEIDYMNWLSGQYTLSAVFVAVEHCLAGTKAKSEYIKKSLMQEIESAQKQETNRPLTDEEKKKQTEQLFMRLRIMGANFNLNKKD